MNIDRNFIAAVTGFSWGLSDLTQEVFFQDLNQIARNQSEGQGTVYELRRSDETLSRIDTFMENLPNTDCTSLVQEIAIKILAAKTLQARYASRPLSFVEAGSLLGKNELTHVGTVVKILLTTVARELSRLHEEVPQNEIKAAVLIFGPKLAEAHIFQLMSKDHLI